MELQGGGGDGTSDRAFDGFGGGGGFGCTGGQQKNLAGLENRTDTHGDSTSRALFARAEEFGVVVERFAAQDFEACARSQAGSGLVEADMPIAPNAEKLEVDTACGADRVFVGGAVGIVVGADAAIGDMNVARWHIDVTKEMFMHK